MRRIELGHLGIAVAIVVAAILFAFSARPIVVRVELPSGARGLPAGGEPPPELRLAESTTCRQIQIKYLNGAETTLEAGKGDLGRYHGLYPRQGDAFLVVHLVSEGDAMNAAKDRMLIPYATVASVTCRK